MLFNLKQAKIHQAVSWFKFPLFRCQKFFLVALVVLGIFVLTLLQDLENLPFLGFYLVLLVCFFEMRAFFNNYLKEPKTAITLEEALKAPDNYNLAQFLDFEAALALNSKGSLLFRLLKRKFPAVEFVFQRSNLGKKELLRFIKESQAEDREKVVSKALETAKNNQRQKATIGDLFFALSSENSVFKQFLLDNDFNQSDILNLINWHYRLNFIKTRNKKWWSKENLRKKGSVARDFVSSYTLNLDRFGIDLRQRIKKTAFREIVGHNEELLLLERALSKEANRNALLVGEAGAGKFALVEKIAQAMFQGKATQVLNYKRIIDLDLSSLAACCEGEAIFERCFGEALKAGNVILCLKNIESFVSGEKSVGSVNIAAALGRYLSYPQFQVIALTDYAGLHNVLEQKGALLNFFEKIEVREITRQETLLVLENAVAFFENKYKRFISYQALKEVLNLSSRYFPQMMLPEKAMRLLDESLAYLSLNTKEKELLKEHVQKVVFEKTQVPVGALEDKEKELLLRLEKEIHRYLIDQEEAVSEVANALRRVRAQVSKKQGPIGSFLFLGPTGVGKTELAKTLTKIYFASEKKMVRFDMSEFQQPDDIKRLIGEGKTTGILANQVREEPFCLLLLDELEKADKNILNLFLQVLDEGFLTDGQGRRVDFSNTMIIATSNAGSALIREKVKANTPSGAIKEELLDYLIKENIYRPEFLNRFDATVFFQPLGKNELLQIAQLMLGKLSADLLDKGIVFEISLPLKEKIVNLSYSPEFGAREMKRIIQDRVENVLAKALLSGEIKRGQRITINDNFEITKI